MKVDVYIIRKSNRCLVQFLIWTTFIPRKTIEATHRVIFALFFDSVTNTVIQFAIRYAYEM